MRAAVFRTSNRQLAVDTVADRPPRRAGGDNTDVVTLDGAPSAFEQLRGRNNQCKVIIRPF